MSLRLITPPALLPVTTAEMKAHLRVDISDDDALIDAMTAAAVGKCEHYTGRSLMPQTWELTLDEFPDAFVLTRTPVASITSVKYIDPDGVEITLSTNQYYLDNTSDYKPHYLVPEYSTSWPTPRSQANAVKVRYLAGYATSVDVPQDLKSWIKLMVGAMYEYREAYSDKEIKMGFADTFLSRHKVY